MNRYPKYIFKIDSIYQITSQHTILSKYQKSEPISAMLRCGENEDEKGHSWILHGFLENSTFYCGSRGKQHLPVCIWSQGRWQKNCLRLYIWLLVFWLRWRLHVLYPFVITCGKNRPLRWAHLPHLQNIRNYNGLWVPNVPGICHSGIYWACLKHLPTVLRTTRGPEGHEPSSCSPKHTILT